MSNRTIAIIFVVLAWVLLVGTIIIGFPLFIIYAIACIALAHIVYHREDTKT